MVERVVISDDASPCTADVTLSEVVGLPGVTVIRHRLNAGIARGLNDGLVLARELGATWLLTLDQDSDVPPDYLSCLLADREAAMGAGLPVGAIGPAVISDVSGDLDYPITVMAGHPTTAEIFQSGALWSVNALRAGFDESFGIDAVDAAACLALREQGYIIALSRTSRLNHSWGGARQVRILGRDVAVTGHAVDRRTSMVRNRLRLAPREFRQSPAQAIRSLRRLTLNTVLAVTVEEDRWSKAKASARGVLPRRRSPEAH